ncbi:flagellar basal body P-ring protein FlgI [Porticoccaceae bacterium LTM1]|nr:flagellar basal body P-ring protein FlgI [Porticoccaceae bacterium LTM1]
MNNWKRPLMMLLAGWLLAQSAAAERIKDIAGIEGVRNNQLIGYGLVVGLDGTGDQTTQTQFTVQSFKNMLAQLGVVIPPGVTPQLKNVAAVMVHADLPAFARPGQNIDVTVSSIGNAKSLRGGSLLMTPLKGANGQVYAMAQGSLVVSGFGAEGADGSQVSVNISSAGRIPNGATVERSVPSPFTSGNELVLNLHQPDFTTARRLAETVNGMFGPGVASPIDGGSIKVRTPVDLAQKVAFVSELENLNFEPGNAAARVVVNARTGTIVIGSEVHILPAAVAHGSLTVSVSETPDVSQPEPFARRGETVAFSDSDIDIQQEEARMFTIKPGVTLDELVSAINRVGAAPGDLMAILEALKQAGALRGELVVI